MTMVTGKRNVSGFRPTFSRNTPSWSALARASNVMEQSAVCNANPGDGTVPGPYIAYVTGLNKSQLAIKYAQASSSDTTVEIKADQKEYTIEFK